jgi:hypothetical protein
MTFSNRRRFIRLLWAFVSQGVLPFALGFVFALISVTHVVTESFSALDKAGFGSCVKQPGQGGN